MKGVTPDIILPTLYSEIEIGERRDKAALKWDEIPAARYDVVSNPVNVNTLSALSNKRVNENETFSLIREGAARIKQKEKNNSYALNEIAFKKQTEQESTTSKKMEELEKKAKTLTIVNLKDDMANINRDSSTITKNKEWIKNLSKDIYLAETVNIMNDLLKTQSKVNMETGMR